MVLKPGREDDARKIFEKWQLDFAVVGQTTDTSHLVVRHKGEVMADLPLSALGDGAPVYQRPFDLTPPPELLDPGQVPAPKNLPAALKQLIGSPDLCSKRWVWEQYDHMVMGDTVERPGSDAAIVRVHGTDKALAVTVDTTPRYVAADPLEGGKQAVAEVWRNLTAVGADPLAITDCLNFGSPEKPEIMGQFAGAVDGMCQACSALDFPVVSGNVSFYNETNQDSILPTPAVGGVGLLPDLHKRCNLALKEDGDVLLLIGEERGHLGQSVYLRDYLNRRDGAPPPVDLPAERAAGDFVRDLIRSTQVNAVHDCSDGGLYVAVAEMAMAGGIGVDILLGTSGLPAHAILFGEDQARYILSAAPAQAEHILERAIGRKITARKLGRVTGHALTIEGSDAISIEELNQIHERWLPNYMNSG